MGAAERRLTLGVPTVDGDGVKFTDMFPRNKSLRRYALCLSYRGAPYEESAWTMIRLLDYPPSNVVRVVVCLLHARRRTTSYRYCTAWPRRCATTGGGQKPCGGGEAVFAIVENSIERTSDEGGPRRGESPLQHRL